MEGAPFFELSGGKVFGEMWCHRFGPSDRFPSSGSIYGSRYVCARVKSLEKTAMTIERPMVNRKMQPSRPVIVAALKVYNERRCQTVAG